jgi:hypothetical protein
MTYKDDCDALTAGTDPMWRVNVSCDMADDDAQIELRAPTIREACIKAEAFAAKYPDMLFSMDPTPTFHADRVNFERIHDNGDAFVAPEEKVVYIENKAAGTSEWAILAADGTFVQRGFEHRYQAEVAVSNRIHDWEVAHGLREPDEEPDLHDGEEQYAGSDLPFPGQEG